MILIINTSLNGKVELFLNGKLKSIETAKQSLVLPSETELFLKEANTDWKDLTAIGVVVGPGSFTGIRLGIAYAKGLSMGLNIPVVPVNAFEIYLSQTPDAFVALNSGRSDLFVAARGIEPGTMKIEDIETKQMEYPRTVGHKPFDLKDALPIIEQKLATGNLAPAVPMYLRPSYAEIQQNQKCSKQ
jgi:tRNA threonylcarbamoyl adenosine modification protein YeaZ